MYYHDILTQHEASAQTLTAHCSPELADWLDPTGALRRGGLLVVDCPSLGIPYQVPGSKEIRFAPVTVPPEAMMNTMVFGILRDLDEEMRAYQRRERAIHQACEGLREAEIVRTMCRYELESDECFTAREKALLLL